MRQYASGLALNLDIAFFIGTVKYLSLLRIGFVASGCVYVVPSLLSFIVPLAHGLRDNKDDFREDVMYTGIDTFPGDSCGCLSFAPPKPSLIINEETEGGR
jgi:hypothetical protein